MPEFNDIWEIEPLIWSASAAVLFIIVVVVLMVACSSALAYFEVEFVR